MNPFFGISYSSGEELEKIVVERYEARRKLLLFLKELDTYSNLKTKIPLSELRVISYMYARQLEEQEREIRRFQGPR